MSGNQAIQSLYFMPCQQNKQESQSQVSFIFWSKSSKIKMPSVLGLTINMKWKGKETNGFTYFLLPCHNKQTNRFFILYLSMRKEESIYRMKGTSLLACQLLKWLALPLIQPGNRYLLRFIGSSPMPFSLRSLPRYRPSNNCYWKLLLVANTTAMQVRKSNYSPTWEQLLLCIVSLPEK